MIKNLKISARSTGGFLTIAAIEAIIGIVGWIQLNEVGSNLDKVSTICLPAIQSLLVLDEAQAAIDGAENALLSFPASDAERSAAYRRFDEKKKTIDENWKIYDRLPRNPEAEKAWQLFVPKWNKWLNDHEEFVHLVQAWEKDKTEAN
jgi:methyl-accepting chemotaxis protein